MFKPLSLTGIYGYNPLRNLSILLCMNIFFWPKWITTVHYIKNKHKRVTSIPWVHERLKIKSQIDGLNIS